MRKDTRYTQFEDISDPFLGRLSGTGHDPTKAYSPTFYSPNIYQKFLTQTL